MNMLSLFDGISCGQLAGQRAGIKIDRYYASEIDKYAITITQRNFPSTIRLGDVGKVRPITLPSIDLLLAGSPCTGLSRAGYRKHFDDTHSGLFFEFLRIKNAINPRFWLLENVRMKREWQNTISDLLGVAPIEMDSALVSAQQRRRLYWTNILGIKQPIDKGIGLSSILEDADLLELDRDKALPLGATCFQGDSYAVYKVKRRKQVLLYAPGKCPTLPLKVTQEVVDNALRYTRLLTVKECERLQTLPDGYTAGVSNSQRYKSIGNGWTVDIIAHILSFIHEAPVRETKTAVQLRLF